MSNLESNLDTGFSWFKVIALTLGISALMLAQFLPAGVLVPMSLDLGVSEGVVGQTVTVTSIFAVISSLFISYIAKDVDRKKILIFLSLLTFISCLAMMVLESIYTIMLSRAILGISIGGYWALVTAVVYKIVPESQIPKALSIVFGGASFSGMLAAPLGSYIGNIIGWRNVFGINAAMALLAVVALMGFLPFVSAGGAVDIKTIFRVSRKKGVTPGLLTIFTAFFGRYAFLTYLNPIVENELGYDSIYTSIFFFMFDFFYFVGTFIAAWSIKNHYQKTLYLPQLGLFISMLCFIVFAGSVWPLAVILILAGICFGHVPIVWSSWGPNFQPNYTEQMGGLFVASTQLASTFGAMLGGVIYDWSGFRVLVISAAIVWLLSAILAKSSVSIK